ncbi:MAG TPA: LysE family transporter [Microvirga sp.]|jgi:threonine/homoserine/homoserine lactone efflux protein
MSIDLTGMALFTLAAVVLLGSPGPAIAALVAVGRTEGIMRGLRFYGGLQVGLAAAAAFSAAGLFSLVQSIPAATVVMSTVATIYLLYLAYKIATSPVGNGTDVSGAVPASTALGGFLLGVTNPKAYVAFASLMASYSVVRSDGPADATAKWLLCVIVMIVVDLAWLWLGAIVQKAKLSAGAERLLNVAMGGTIVITAIIALI